MRWRAASSGGATLTGAALQKREGRFILSLNDVPTARTLFAQPRSRRSSSAIRREERIT